MKSIKPSVKMKYVPFGQKPATNEIEKIEWSGNIQNTAF